MAKTEYNDEFRREAVRLATSREKSIAQTARDLGVPGALVVALWCAATAADVGRETQEVTPERAADAVRAFEGDGDLKLPRAVRKEIRGRPVLVFSVGGKYWRVDARLGTVSSAYYGAPPFGVAPDRPLGRDVLTKVARSYATQHFPGFMRRPVRETARIGQSAWITFREYLPANGALSGNSISVVLDLSGKVWSVGIVDEPVPQAAREKPAVARAGGPDCRAGCQSPNRRGGAGGQAAVVAGGP